MDQFDIQHCLTPSLDRPTVAVLGDSFGFDSVLGLKAVFGDRYHVTGANLSGCTPLPVESATPRRQACVEFNQRRLEFVKKHHYDAIFLAGNWWSPAMAREVARLVEELKPFGTKIYVLGVRVAFDTTVGDILISAGNIPDANAILRSHALAERFANNDQFRTIISASGGIYLDVLDRQCGERSCNAVTRDGKLIYFDKSHLTRVGAEILARSVGSSAGGSL